MFPLDLIVPYAVVAGSGGGLGRECVFLFSSKKNQAGNYSPRKIYFPLPVILFVLCFSYAFVVYSASHEINLMHF